MFGLFGKKNNKPAAMNPGMELMFTNSTMRLSPDEMAQILRTSPEKLAAFEKAYQVKAIDSFDENDVFGMNAKTAVSQNQNRNLSDTCPEWMVDAITRKLIGETHTVRFQNGRIERCDWSLFGANVQPVGKDQLMAVDEPGRPALTHEYMKCHIPGETDGTLLWMWDQYQKATDPEMKQRFYHMFRQGLDILDLGPVTYAMIGTNPTSMSHWLPFIYKQALEAGFKVPDTVIAKVPITMLQLTRLEYIGLSPATLKIVDGWAHHIFELHDDREYFIKTGTYSSKFDFRNCHVHGEKEVRELGEYLLFIHSQAIEAAGPLSLPSIYGMSTTNEWVVRDFIPDREDLPHIYKGLPLRTEYRVFVDFDKKTVIGTSPYWEPGMMKQRFAHGGSIHEKHDYVTYLTREKDMLAEYAANIDKVKSMCQNVARTADLEGQWSVDVMQDGTDLYLIDMAPAENSALYGCVPKQLRRPMTENWIPTLG